MKNIWMPCALALAVAGCNQQEEPQDLLVVDQDNDGFVDASDAFPEDAKEWADNDKDQLGDNADLDDDNDGIPDAADAFPLNDKESADLDGDGTGNNADTDDDGDGVLDAEDAFPLDILESQDADNDGIGDNADLDDDNDSFPDSVDAFPHDDTESSDFDLDGVGDNADEDDDNDGVLDVSDAFPANALEFADNDGDGTGDNADLDDDNDGVSDGEDVFPFDANEHADNDGDAIGDNADEDDDNDGHLDGEDAFPLDASEQVDSDGDNTGDNADLDDDNDGVNDNLDALPLDPSEQIDTDGDGIGNNADTDDDNDGTNDEQDVFPLDAVEQFDNDGDEIGDNSDTDDDNDSHLDANDAFPFDASEHLDTDGDGIGNNADLDDDGDSVADAKDVFPLDASESEDFDLDGVGDNADLDDDDDGVADASDVFPFDPAESADNDQDGLGDNADTDDDNDGVEDDQDAFPFDESEWVDTDGDKIGNNADLDDDGDSVNDIDDASPLDPANAYVPVWNASAANQFRSKSFVESIGTPSGVEIFDVDGNGALDIVVSSTSARQLGWHSRSGASDWSQSAFFNTVIDQNGSGWSILKPARMDADNDTDFVYANGYQVTVQTLENPRDWADKWTWQSNHVAYVQNTRDLTIADIDRDEDQDIILMDHQGDLYWLENEGALQFSTQVISRCYGDASEFSVADLDADQDLDIALSCATDNKLVWLEQEDGTQTFTAHNVATFDSQTNKVGKVAIAQVLPENRKPELIAQVGEDILLYQWDGAKLTASKIANSGPVAEISVADLNADSRPDVVLSYQDGRIIWLANQANGKFVERSASNSLQEASSTRVADFDGDGDTDIIAADRLSDKLYWLDNQAELSLNANVNSTSIHTFDAFDADGQALTYSLYNSLNNGAKLTIDAQTGELSFVTDAPQAAGIYRATVEASDGYDSIQLVIEVVVEQPR